MFLCRHISTGRTSAAHDKRPNHGESVEISCKPPEIGGIVVWFRVLDTSRMEFIATFSSTGLLKSPETLPNYSTEKIKDHILTLKSYQPAKDSGLYSCGSLKNNHLMFGDVTRVLGGAFNFTTTSLEAVVLHPGPQDPLLLHT